MRIVPVPTKQVPDWQALADAYDLFGPFNIPADIDANAAHAALHRRGLGVRKVKRDGVHVAYQVGPLQRRLKA